MKMNDVIKKSFLEGFDTDISTTKIMITLIITAIIGIYIYIVYKYKSKSSFYSKDFNNVLALLPVVTGAIVLAMQSSIVISLGMVGALSIVRFRNAVKNSLDLLFLFWSISIGIICGAGLYEIGLLLSLVVTILLLILDIVPIKKHSLLLIINSKNIEIEKELTPILKRLTSSYIVKSRSIHDKNIDLIIEIRSKKDIELLKECNKLKDILNVSLMSHDGEERL